MSGWDEESGRGLHGTHNRTSQTAMRIWAKAMASEIREVPAHTHCKDVSFLRNGSLHTSQRTSSYARVLSCSSPRSKGEGAVSRAQPRYEHLGVEELPYGRLFIVPWLGTRYAYKTIAAQYVKHQCWCNFVCVCLDNSRDSEITEQKHKCCH